MKRKKQVLFGSFNAAGDLACGCQPGVNAHFVKPAVAWRLFVLLEEVRALRITVNKPLPELDQAPLRTAVLRRRAGEFEVIKKQKNTR